MAQNRPDKPNITLPDDFGGTQTPFSDELVESGYEPSIPQIIEGGNLNWMLNGFFQNTKYMRAVLDYVRDTPIGKMFWVNQSGQMDYVQPAVIATDVEYETGTATDKTPTVKQVVDNFTEQQTEIDSLFYIGDIKTSARTSNHGNWVLCDGSELSRATYSSLFSVIGTTYGSGDGSTTFNIPNYSNGVVPRGTTIDVMGNGKGLGVSNRDGGATLAGYLTGKDSGSGHGYSIQVTSSNTIGNTGSGTHLSGVTGVITDATKSGLTGALSSSTQINYFIKAA